MCIFLAAPRIPSLYYVSKRTGWVEFKKIVIISDIYYCIYADILGGWVGGS